MRRAPARAADRRAAGLRRAGPDAHRDRRLGDRAQRVPLRGRRARSSSRSEGQTPPQVLVVRVRDEGPGIADLPTDPRRPLPLDRPGMGLGILGARRLMDRFEIESAPGRGHHRHACGSSCPRTRPLVAGPRRRRGWRTSWPGERAAEPARRGAAAEPGAAARPGGAAPPPGRAGRASTASWRTPTAAWSRSTPSSTRRPSTCGAPTR